MKLPRTVKNNKWRYLSLTAGFFLLVAPFAFLTQLAFLLVGKEGQATLHSICYKLPLDWLISGPGDFFALGIVATSFVVITLMVAFLFGPLFCGHLCPVGAFGELVSRIAPIPDRYRMRLKDPGITARLRYGFLAGFVILAWMIGKPTALCPYGIDLGRYCTSSIFQYFSLGLFSDQLTTSFWNTGALLTIAVWLVLGGILMVGGYTIQLASVNQSQAGPGSNIVLSIELDIYSGGSLIERVVLVDEYPPDGGSRLKGDVHVHKTLAEDLYISFDRMTGSDVLVEAKVVPLVNLVWSGAVMLGVGILVRLGASRNSPA